MVNSGMTLEEIKRDVLESCNEDTTGSWELWWGSEPKDLDSELDLKKNFVEAVDQLVKEGKIKAVHHGPWASPDAKYSEATYDRARLEYEIDHSLKETGLDPDTFFWFELTQEGKEWLDRQWRKERAEKFDMYILAGIATAGSDHEKYKEGERHGVLAYIQTTSHEAAVAIARNELAKHGWKDLWVDKTGIIDVSDKKDNESVQTALRDGFSAVIYGNAEAN